jgi:hypothetical protein
VPSIQPTIQQTRQPTNLQTNNINQPTKPPTNPPTSQPGNKPTSQPANQPTKVYLASQQASLRVIEGEPAMPAFAANQATCALELIGLSQPNA